MKGTLTFQAEEPHSGAVDLTLSTSTVGATPPPQVHHAWGTVDAVLDDDASNPCTGSFAWASFTDPAETGGSLHLECKDGSVLGARLAIAAIEAPSSSGGGTWTFDVRLEDGFFVAR